MAKPFLKWAGGKRSLLPALLSHTPAEIQNYHEPFLGAGAFFIELKSTGRIKGEAWLGDTNQELVNAWNHLDSVAFALAKIASKQESLTREAFEEVRAIQPSQLDSLNRAARFIYLNRTCFNGLYRENKKGQFNVPWGNYKNPKICDEANLKEVAKLIDVNTFVENEPFWAVLDRAIEGDFVYFDPPYIPLSSTSNFTSFTREGFTLTDQRLLRAVADKLTEKKVCVLVSNSDTERTREIWKDWDIATISVKRSISADGSKRNKVSEILAKNY